MKKIISKTGIGGTFEGYVEILFNYKIKVEQIPNVSICQPPYLHKESVHLVRAIAGPATLYSIEFSYDWDVFKFKDEAEKILSYHLLRQCGAAPGQSLIDKLKLSGYED